MDTSVIRDKTVLRANRQEFAELAAENGTGNYKLVLDLLKKVLLIK